MSMATTMDVEVEGARPAGDTAQLSMPAQQPPAVEIAQSSTTQQPRPASFSILASSRPSQPMADIALAMQDLSLSAAHRTTIATSFTTMAIAAAPPGLPEHPLQVQGIGPVTPSASVSTGSAAESKCTTAATSTSSSSFATLSSQSAGGCDPGAGQVLMEAFRLSGDACYSCDDAMKRLHALVSELRNDKNPVKQLSAVQNIRTLSYSLPLPAILPVMDLMVGLHVVEHLVHIISADMFHSDEAKVIAVPKDLGIRAPSRSTC
jgi:hypothetical protein